jgi:hypothetical protein
MYLHTAHNSEELLSSLRDIDISVPLRSEGRLTDDVERWVVCRLLSTLATSNELPYPISLIKRERPDFQLTLGTVLAGIEVTEATSRNYAAFSALAEREFPDALLEPSHFRWGAPELSTKEMRELLKQSQLSGTPWAGDAPEREWALYMESVVNAKHAKLAKAGFQQYQFNWLSIYDNIPGVIVKLEKAVRFLAEKLEAIWQSTPMFDALYIESGRTIVRIKPEGIEFWPLQDLW